MTTPVDICNVALAHIGHKATIASIDPPEASVEAEYGALLWPTVRRSTLSSHSWGFATERASLASLSVTPPSPWTYAYPMPSASVRFLGVKDPNAGDDIPFSDCRVGRQAGQSVIYTDVENAVAVYVADVTDTLLYTSELITAQEYLLAAKFAGPIIKGTEGVRIGRAMTELGMYHLGEAKRIDSAQTQNSDVTSPSTYKAGHLQARGISTVTPDADITRS